MELCDELIAQYEEPLVVSRERQWESFRPQPHPFYGSWPQDGTSPRVNRYATLLLSVIVY